jgi:DNA-binding beta-propeller fold protein YncE
MGILDLALISERWPTLPQGFELGLVSAIEGDSRGRIYLSHRGPHPVLCFDEAGVFLGEPGIGDIEASVFYDFSQAPPIAFGRRPWMHGLHVDPWDNLWITDVGRHIVMKFSPEWKLIMILGTPDRSGETGELLNQPTDALAAPSGDIFVADGYGNSRIVKFSGDGNFISAWGTRGVAASQFHTPHVLAFDGKERLYVSDRENDRIQVFDPNGGLLAIWPGYHSINGVGLAPNDHLFLVGGLDNNIILASDTGQQLRSWTHQPVKADPHWLWYDGKDRLYVANVGASSVTRYAIVNDPSTAHLPGGSGFSRSAG